MTEMERTLVEVRTLLGVAIQMIAIARADKVSKLLDYDSIKELEQIENSVIEFRRNLTDIVL